MLAPDGRERGAWGKAGGEQDNQQMQVVQPAHLTPRQTALWAVFEHRQAQKDCFFIPIGNLEWLYINIFIFTASCQVKVIFPYATS